MGDSLSDPRSAGGHYIRILQSRSPKSRFDNYGKGGHMTNQMRRRFQRDVLASSKPRYSHVIVFGGVNDLISNLTAHRTNDRIEGDLSQMYRWAKQANARVVGITVTPWGGFKRYFNQERSKNTQLLNSWSRSHPGSPNTGRPSTPISSCPAVTPSTSAQVTFLRSTTVYTSAKRRMPSLPKRYGERSSLDVYNSNGYSFGARTG